MMHGWVFHHGTLAGVIVPSLQHAAQKCRLAGDIALFRGRRSP
jgi:hypothetical protein